MDFIVHIGEGKTGSSAIQSALNVSSSELLEKGILYDPPRVGSGHLHYITLIGLSSRTLPAGGAERVKSHIQALKDTIRRVQPKLVILSAESFLGLNRRQVDALLSAIDIPFSGMHCVAFVRDPADFYVSASQQRLKLAPTLVPPVKFSRTVATNFQAWAGHPQCASAWASEFDRKVLRNASAIAEFASIVSEVAGERILLPEQNQNISMTAEQVIAMQNYHAQSLSGLSRNNKEVLNILSLFNEINTSGSVIGTRIELKLGVRAVIYEKNLNDVERLLQMFPWFIFPKFRMFQQSQPDLDWVNSGSGDFSDLISEYNSDVVRLNESIIRGESIDRILEDNNDSIIDFDKLSVALRAFYGD